MYLKLKVKTEAKQDTIEKTKVDEFRVMVKVKAERNMANRRVIELLAEYLKIPVNKIRLISGHTSPSKIVSVVE